MNDEAIQKEPEYGLVGEFGIGHLIRLTHVNDLRQWRMNLWSTFFGQQKQYTWEIRVLREYLSRNYLSKVLKLVGRQVYLSKLKPG